MITPGEPLPYSSEDFRREIKRVKRKRGIIVGLSIALALLVILAFIMVLALRIPSSLHTVPDDSMEPMLSKGQVVLIENVSAPSANDVVAFQNADGNEQIKRVVAIAGEWVNVTGNNTIVVSAVPLQGETSIGQSGDNVNIIASRQVPENACFVIADKDDNPLESLYQTDGFVAYGQIYGRATWRMWPLARLK